jgi:hypothetical protein
MFQYGQASAPAAKRTCSIAEGNEDRACPHRHVGITILFIILERLIDKTYKPGWPYQFITRLRSSLRNTDYSAFDELPVHIATTVLLESFRTRSTAFWTSRNINLPHSK